MRLKAWKEKMRKMKGSTINISMTTEKEISAGLTIMRKERCSSKMSTRKKKTTTTTKIRMRIILKIRIFGKTLILILKILCKPPTKEKLIISAEAVMMMIKKIYMSSKNNNETNTYLKPQPQQRHWLKSAQVTNRATDLKS